MKRQIQMKRRADSGNQRNRVSGTYARFLLNQKMFITGSECYDSDANLYPVPS